MNNDSKITLSHLQKNAYIYIRQSTQHQVRENIESQQRQYELVQLAQQYNWSEDSITIIDDDLGRSASTTNDRLLLGLKGTMSEAELHMLKSRMLEGLYHKAQKGELKLL